jgi:uncharacterized protein YpuA (DUF1002 family)
MKSTHNQIHILFHFVTKQKRLNINYHKNKVKKQKTKNVQIKFSKLAQVQEKTMLWQEWSSFEHIWNRFINENQDYIKTHFSSWEVYKDLGKGNS